MDSPSHPMHSLKKERTESMTKGYQCLVLHAHLPYVRHPEDEHFLEENWLNEAITECYLPLIDMMERLLYENIDFRLTMTISPPLASMFADELLQNRYRRFLIRLIELSNKEIERTMQYEPQFHESAKMYNTIFIKNLSIFDRFNGNLNNAFRHLQDSGKLEIITCGATHGFFPLIGVQRETVKAQIAVAVKTHERFFGRKPQGIWLPECGFNPGDDEILKEFGLKYFFVDSHGILFAEKQPKYGTYAPLYCPSGVAAFGRDRESSKQVWSADEGYPGDYDYREFYRDIGHDLPFEYISPYIHPSGLRIQTGIKYFRISGKEASKEPYVMNYADYKTGIHAENFLFNRNKQVEFWGNIFDRPPLIISPYDAELFGHWWFEGPMFLEKYLRLSAKQNIIKLITPPEYLSLYPNNQPSMPSMSSWGNKGYNDVWLEESNEWIYPHLHRAAERMINLARQHENADGIVKRILNQASRELLLAQSSDWAFIMKTGTMVEYAVARTKEHIGNFLLLNEQLNNNFYDENFLNRIEAKNNIFPDIDYRVFA